MNSKKDSTDYLSVKLIAQGALLLLLLLLLLDGCFFLLLGVHNVQCNLTTFLLNFKQVNKSRSAKT